MRHIDCKHYIANGDLLIGAPARMGKTISKGYCTKHDELYYCDGDDCPYLKYQNDELEVRMILIGVSVYYHKLFWDELAIKASEFLDGLNSLTGLGEKICNDLEVIE